MYIFVVKIIKKCVCIEKYFILTNIFIVVDETGSASTSNSKCCGCFQKRNREALLEMYSLRCSDHQKCSERSHLGPIDSDCAFGNKMCKTNKTIKETQQNANYAEYELADDAISFDKKSNTECILSNSYQYDHAKNLYITVSGKEELPCIHEIKYMSDNKADTKNVSEKLEFAANKVIKERVKNETNNGNLNRLNTKSIYSFCTLPKSRRKDSDQKNFSRHIVPPKRVTPDGTHIYYWCDLNKKDYGKILHNLYLIIPKENLIKKIIIFDFIESSYQIY